MGLVDGLAGSRPLAVWKQCGVRCLVWVQTLTVYAERRPSKCHQNLFAAVSSETGDSEIGLGYEEIDYEQQRVSLSLGYRCSSKSGTVNHLAQSLL